MAKIEIKNLRIRTIIGANDWERNRKQDIIINATIHYNAGKAIKSDDLKDSVDYKVITKRIIREVEASNFFLLERLCDLVLKIILKNKTVQKATVKIDKPGALRFADSVSLELTEKR